MENTGNQTSAHSPGHLYTITIPIATINPNRMTGTLLVDFDTAGITQYISKFGTDLNGTLFLYSEDGTLFYDSTGNYNQGYGFNIAPNIRWEHTRVDGEVFYHAGITSAAPPVHIVSVISENVILNKIHPIQVTIFIACALSVILCTILMVINSKHVSGRLNVILNSMREMRNGSFSKRIELSHKNDELNEIAISFNQMNEHLGNYIDRVYKSELQQKNMALNQKNAELLALQSQINPHFLYNTLETIRMKAVIDGSRDAGEMIFLLSEMFRHQIKGKSIVSIEEEVQNCISYLKLFKIRFGNSLSYNIQVEESILQYFMPKQLLQPIIENYIVHGFDLGKGNNLLELKGCRKENDLFLTISDNGKGIGRETLQSIQSGLEQAEQGDLNSIGLYNVNKRIKLIYGQEYGCTLHSIESLETVVTLHFPLIEPEELKKHVQGRSC